MWRCFIGSLWPCAERMTSEPGASLDAAHTVWWVQSRGMIDCMCSKEYTDICWLNESMHNFLSCFLNLLRSLFKSCIIIALVLYEGHNNTILVILLWELIIDHGNLIPAFWLYHCMSFPTYPQEYTVLKYANGKCRKSFDTDECFYAIKTKSFLNELI